MSRHSTFILFLSLFTACHDASLNQSFAIPDPGEDCNGEDDDGDGEIDEGFPDRDGDGIADCIDRSCTPTLEYTEEVALADTCWTPGSVANPWRIGIEWQVPHHPSDSAYAHVFQTATGRFADTNGDGAVTPDDDAAVMVAFHNGTPSEPSITDVKLAGLSGKDGRLVWEMNADLDLSIATPLLLVDIHGDGTPEVVIVDADRHLVALDHTGAEVFRSHDALAVPEEAPFMKISAIDVNGDGVPDLLSKDLVVDGVTGATLAFGFSSSSDDIIYWDATVFDLDFDGTPELFHGDQLHNTDGAILWTAQESTDDPYGHWPLAAEIDGDAESELIIVRAGQWEIYDHDGTLLSEQSIKTKGAAPPCVADFDGDGTMEVANNVGNGLDMRELNGERQWIIRADDSSGFASCSAFDFNADGAEEVVFADEHTFFIVDGRTGEIRFRDNVHNSSTEFEHPTIGDIDGDGSVEIVVSADGRAHGNRTGITVYGHETGAWPPADFVWAHHDFAPNRVTRTGAVNAPDLDTTGGYLRAKTRLDVDLDAQIIDVCIASCDEEGAASARIEVTNPGRDVPPDTVSVGLWGIEEAGTKVLLYEAEIDPIAPGATWGTDVPFSPIAFVDLELVIDEQNRFFECNETDNTATWGVAFCE